MFYYAWGFQIDMNIYFYHLNGQGMGVTIEYRKCKGQESITEAESSMKGQTSWPLTVWQVDSGENKCPNLDFQWCLALLELNQKQEGKGDIDA